MNWIKIYFSPFKPIIPRLYIGKVAIGTPIFYPRVWKKATTKLAHKATLESIKKQEVFNKNHPESAQPIKSYNIIFKEKMQCKFAVDKKIGFDFVGLGWKTKWDEYDIREEWNPVWSFVFFKWQIALMFIPKTFHYWECFLAYSLCTDKSKSWKERIIEAKEKFPCQWISYEGGVQKPICYWDNSLKTKYL